MSTNVRLYNEANLSQQLNLAPQLLNWLKVLQMPSLELSQMINLELNSNPTLEIEEPETADWDEVADAFDGDETSFEDSTVDERLSMLAEIDTEWKEADEPKLASNDYLQEKRDFMMDHLVKGKSLQDELELAIRLSDLSAEERVLARTMAGYIDDRGYLSVTLENLADNYDVLLGEWDYALYKFQSIVPAGIGARDLRECMLLQLRAMEEDTSLAESFVSEWLDIFLLRGEQMVMDEMGLAADCFNKMLNQLRTLDPEPGRMYVACPVEEIKADLRIFLEGDELRVELCDSYIPKLRLSSFCKRLLDQRKGKKTDLDYIRRKLRDASFLIQGISQRQETMLKVIEQIMRVQRDYLMTHDGELKPLTMNKVAAIIGVHETTVSRAIANKYVETPRGMVEMRAFFKVGYRCADGSAVTPERVKERMMGMIRDEDSAHPLTDQQITERFKKQGIKVARRTIAKYREELEIPSSKVRLMRARASVNVQRAMAV